MIMVSIIIIMIIIINIFLQKMLDGNTDMSTVKRNNLTKPIVARYVRIHPTAWQTDVCLRTEFYGCPGRTILKQVQLSVTRITTDKITSKGEHLPRSEEKLITSPMKNL